MEKIKVICPNCGSEVEADKFAVAVFCESCGGKVVIKRDKNDEISEFEKKKVLLRRAFETREVSDVMSRAKDVIELSPNDFFANFLYAYCLLRRGNNNSMLNFFNHAEVSSATEEEMDTVLSEITKSRNYYEQKKTFIERVAASGFNIVNYLEYLKLVEKEDKGNNGELYISACKKLNINCAILYGLFVTLAVIVIAALITDTKNIVFIEIVISELAAITVLTFLANKFGYNGFCLFATLIVSFGTYQIIRAIVTYSIYSKCLRQQGVGITYKSLYMHGKL